MGRKGKVRESEGGTQVLEFCLAEHIAAVPIRAGDRVHPNLIRYTHPPRHHGELLALIRSMRNPLTTAAIYLGSKRSFSRRKTRETRRNSSRNSQYLQTSTQSSQKPKTEVLIIHAVTAERLFPGDII